MSKGSENIRLKTWIKKHRTSERKNFSHKPNLRVVTNSMGMYGLYSQNIGVETISMLTYCTEVLQYI